MTTARISERGNGLPIVDDLIYDSTDDTVYRIVSIDSPIHTGHSGSGAGNYIYATVESTGDSAGDLTEEEWDEIEDYGIEITDDEIDILGVGSEFDLPDEAQQDTEMEWYGIVKVQIGDLVYQVGAVIGVPESERRTCRAAGAGVWPHLTAWYADSSDWSCAPASDGSSGLPQSLVLDVIAEISANARKLWRESRA